jgi:hypothetical protein
MTFQCDVETNEDIINMKKEIMGNVQKVVNEVILRLKYLINGYPCKL